MRRPRKEKSSLQVQIVISAHITERSFIPPIMDLNQQYSQVSLMSEYLGPNDSQTITQNPNFPPPQQPATYYPGSQQMQQMGPPQG